MDSSSKVIVAVVEAPVVEYIGVEYIGVDVSKDTLEVALKYESKSFTVGNDLAGIESLLKRRPAAGTCVVVLEGSGGYERDAIAELLQAAHRGRSSIRDRSAISPRGWGISPRPTRSTPACWPSSDRTSNRPV